MKKYQFIIKKTSEKEIKINAAQAKMTFECKQKFAFFYLDPM